MYAFITDKECFQKIDDYTFSRIIKTSKCQETIKHTIITSLIRAYALVSLKIMHKGIRIKGWLPLRLVRDRGAETQTMFPTPLTKALPSYATH